MDQLFQDLIGKPKLNPPKIITVIVDSFSLLEDQAKFLRAILAIPTVKQLPLDSSKHLIQIGPLSRDIAEQVDNSSWITHHYIDYFDDDFCDNLSRDLLNIGANKRAIIFFNDFSKLELMSPKSHLRHLALVHKLKYGGHFCIILYQNSQQSFNSKLLRNIEFISDSVVRVKTCKVGYFLSMWWQTLPLANNKSLIPPVVETCHYTSRIGKNYYDSDLLCFYDRKKVARNYDLESGGHIESQSDEEDNDDDEDEFLSALLSDTSVQVSVSEVNRDSTLPYTQAQNPEQSRIFYYPDKEDDIDEDDPDNDLGI